MASILDNKYFHTIETAEGPIEEGNWEFGWQGVVLGMVDSEYVLVQLYDWMFGEPNLIKLVRLAEMVNWRFYASLDAMKDAFASRQKVRNR
jgi:hypothetical protein